MKDRDPRRLLDAELADPRLRSLLQAGADDVAPAEVLDRSARRLGAALGIPWAHATQAADKLAPSNPAPGAAHTAAGAHAAVGSKLLLASATKAVVVLAVVGGASFAVVKSVQHAPSARERAPRAAQTQPHRQQPPAQMVASAPVAAVPTVSPAVATPSAVGTESARAPVARAPSSATRPASRAEPRAPGVAPTPAVDRSRSAAQPQETAPAAAESKQASSSDSIVRAAELRSLEAAQQVLASNPQLALQRLRSHAEAFPDGWLDEERGALEVQALLQLGAREQAARALDRLAARHPRSIAISRLRNALH